MSKNWFEKFKVEEWLFIAFVITLSFSSLLQFRFLGQKLQLSDLIFVVALIAWFLALILKIKKVRWSYFYLFLAGYAIAVTLSTISSVNPSQSAAKLLGKFYLILIAFLTFNILSSADIFKKVLKAWIFGTGLSLFCSLAGIVLFYAGLKNPKQNLVVHPIFGSLPVGDYPRIEGFFDYPSMFCNFLGLSWMLVILMVSVGWLKHNKFRLFAFAFWIVLFFTLTPGIGGVLLSTSCFLQKRFENSKNRFLSRLILFAGVSAAVVSLFVASITLFAYSPDGSKIPLTDGNFSPSHRAEAWKTGFQTFLQNPILGRGIGMPVAESRFTDPSGRNQLLTDAHNTYISVLGETGLVGFITFFAIVWFVVFKLKRQPSENEFYKTAKFCLLLAFADMFFYQSLTGSYEDARHLWILFGFGTAVAAQFDFQKSEGENLEIAKLLP